MVGPKEETTKDAKGAKMVKAITVEEETTICTRQFPLKKPVCRCSWLIVYIGFQIVFLARLEGTPLSKAYTPYVVEGGRPLTPSKNLIWKTIFYQKNKPDSDR